MVAASGVDEGAGGLGVGGRDQSAGDSSVSASAEVGREAGDDDGNLWGALGADADVVGDGAGVSCVSGAVSVHAEAGVAGGGYFVSGAGRSAECVSSAGVGAGGRAAGSEGV